VQHSVRLGALAARHLADDEHHDVNLLEVRQMVREFTQRVDQRVLVQLLV
jgi:hypothetical protein